MIVGRRAFLRKAGGSAVYLGLQGGQLARDRDFDVVHEDGGRTEALPGRALRGRIRAEA